MAIDFRWICIRTNFIFGRCFFGKRNFLYGFRGKAGGFFALFGAESSAKCKELRLMIKLKRYDKSQVSYHIIKDTMLGAGIEEGCDCFKECISSMQEVVAFLEVIKEENKQ